MKNVVCVCVGHFARQLAFAPSHLTRKMTLPNFVSCDFSERHFYLETFVTSKKAMLIMEVVLLHEKCSLCVYRASCEATPFRTCTVNPKNRASVSWLLVTNCWCRNFSHAEKCNVHHQNNVCWWNIWFVCVMGISPCRTFVYLHILFCRTKFLKIGPCNFRERFLESGIVVPSKKAALIEKTLLFDEENDLCVLQSCCAEAQYLRSELHWPNVLERKRTKKMKDQA